MLKKLKDWQEEWMVEGQKVRLKETNIEGDIKSVVTDLNGPDHIFVHWEKEVAQHCVEIYYESDDISRYLEPINESGTL